MKFNEEAFEGTIDIVAAAMEEAEVELSAKGGKQVAEFFEAIYERLAVIANEEEEDDEEEEDEEEEDEEEVEEDETEEAEEDKESEGTEEAEEEEAEQGSELPVIRTGSFEMYIDAKGKYRFRLKAANGQVIAVSQAYAKKESCLKGIESVKKNAEAAGVKEV